MPDINAVARVSLVTRYSPQWYEAMIPIMEKASEEAIESERLHRILGNRYQAELYADLVEQRLAYLNHLRQHCHASVRSAF